MPYRPYQDPSAIPITFAFEGRRFTATFGRVNGAASSSRFDLTDDQGYHLGSLFYGPDVWQFHSNKYPRMTDLGEYFGAYVISWCETNGA